MELWKRIQSHPVYEYNWYHRIQVFTFNGDYSFTWGEKGNKDGEFNNPRDILELNDLIYIVDSGNHRIQVFDMNGKFITKFVVDSPISMSRNENGVLLLVMVVSYVVLFNWLYLNVY